MKRLLLLVLVLLFPAASLAQAAPTGYEFRLYAVGAASPQSKTPIAVANVVCNQTPPATTPAINPTKMAWNDPANAGKVCMVLPPTTTPILNLPVGSYEGTIVAIDAGGVGLESNRAPFSRQALQPAPTGFAITQ